MKNNKKKDGNGHAGSSFTGRIVGLYAGAEDGASCIMTNKKGDKRKLSIKVRDGTQTAALIGLASSAFLHDLKVHVDLAGSAITGLRLGKKEAPLTVNEPENETAAAV